MKNIRIESLEDLQQTLNRSKIKFGKWKGPGHKTIANLFREISGTECRLIRDEDNNLRRFMKVVLVNVFYTDPEYLVRHKLHHTKTEFESIRRSGHVLSTTVWGESTESLSEKLILGDAWNGVEEKPMDCARRACCEELSFPPEAVNSLGFCVNHAYWKDGGSRSYPGLLSRTGYYEFTVFIPESLYKPDGYQERRSGRTIFFEWTKIQNTCPV